MNAVALAFAMILDAVLGEPRWIWDRIPHPAVLMGRLIGAADKQFNQGEWRLAKGITLVFALIIGALATSRMIQILPFSGILELLIVATLLAQRSLANHVRDVANSLATSTSEARKSVARIVGRDTREMDGPAIARAAVESAAENLSDGLIAPALFYLVFGLPGILIYKVVNTADSMIGYRTANHAEFGWAAARLDDFLNLIPARITGLTIAILSGAITSWNEISSDAKKHRSPNAGWPEAAMARAVGIALAGPRSYEGELIDFPFVNNQARHDAGPHDIRATVRWLWLTWAALLVIVLACALLA